MSIGRVSIQVRVSPRSPRNEITRFQGDVLHVKVSAPPVKGKANAELINFLSKQLGISKACLAIISGQQSRNKLIAIEGISGEELDRRLNSVISSSGAACKPGKQSLPRPD